MGRKLKSYDKDDMDRANEMVNNGSSIRSAASKYKLPISSLQRRIKRKLKKQGEKPTLSSYDEG